MSTLLDIRLKVGLVPADVDVNLVLAYIVQLVFNLLMQLLDFTGFFVMHLGLLLSLGDRIVATHPMLRLVGPGDIFLDWLRVLDHRFLAGAVLDVNSLTWDFGQLVGH